MRYFTIKELCDSDKAVELRIKNEPKLQEVERMRELIDNVLDPLREAYGKPIKVNSGFRTKELNDVLPGASKTSQHMRGEAADITVFTKEGNKWLFDYIKNNLPFDQLINEYDYSWVHVSYTTERTNRQKITKT